MTTTPLPPPYGPPIGLADAKRVMAAAEAEAVRQGWPMVIAIVDSGGHLVLFQRSDQAQHGSETLAQQKARTSVDFRRPTAALQEAIAQGGVHLRLLAATNMLPFEGGVLLLQHGQVVGAIGVSGMQSGQDAQVANAGAAAL